MAWKLDNVTLARIMEPGAGRGARGAGRARGWGWGLAGWDYRTVQASGNRTAPVLPLSGSQVASLA